MPVQCQTRISENQYCNSIKLVSWTLVRTLWKKPRNITLSTADSDSIGTWLSAWQATRWTKVNLWEKKKNILSKCK